MANRRLENRRSETGGMENDGTIQDLLAILLVPSWGLKKTLQFYQKCRQEPQLSMRACFEAVKKEGKVAAEVDWSKLQARAAKLIQECKDHSIGIVPIDSTAYPAALKKCTDPPLILFYRGEPGVLHEKTVAVVGTRQATNYGRVHGHQLVSGLARSGAVIVSGLAYGIDSLAHEACLRVGGKTVAILAHGLDEVYPKGNRLLADKILEQGGCLLSEYPPGVTPSKYTFPQRNRLIAGLSEATVVIESAEQGGSMITANLAHAYGRDVFALPGNVSSAQSVGCNTLIFNDIAKIVWNADQLISSMGWTVLVEEQAEEGGLSKILREIGAASIDQISAASGKSRAELALELLDLQLEGKILELPGKLYSLNEV